MRNFITITSKEQNEKLAENLRSRELELMSYDFEKENHEKAVVALGNIDWTEALQEYKGLPRDVMVARAMSNDLSPDDIKLVADLNSKDKHLAEINAVNIETAKSERLYDAILEALPEGPERDEALAAVAEKEKLEKAKRLG